MVKTTKTYDKYMFLKLRAAQLYREGKTDKAIRLLTRIDNEQAVRFFWVNLRRALHVR